MIFSCSSVFNILFLLAPLKISVLSSPISTVLTCPLGSCDEIYCDAETFLKLIASFPTESFMLGGMIAANIPAYPTTSIEVLSTEPDTFIISDDEGVAPVFYSYRNETALQAVNRHFEEHNFTELVSANGLPTMKSIEIKFRLLQRLLQLAPKNHPSQSLSKEFYRELGIPKISVFYFGTCYRNTDAWYPFIPVFDFKDKPIRYLEIGVHSGCNVMRVALSYALHENSKIYCVDPWVDYAEYEEYKGKQHTVYEEFQANINLLAAVHKNKIVVQRGFSHEEVIKFQENYFDIIYVDGNHEAQFVFEDASLSFRRLKVGGYIIFDDYFWSEGVYRSIGDFYFAYQKHLKFIGSSDGQIFFQKKL